MPSISSLVSVRTRYQRAVNLFSDSQKTHPLQGFIVTPLVCACLKQLFQSISHAQSTHSFMIYGPYGAGKSTFALFLHELFKQGLDGLFDPQSAFSSLQTVNQKLSAQFQNMKCAQRPWLCIPITARRMALGYVILEGLLKVHKELSHSTNNLIREIETSLSNKLWQDSQFVLRMVEATHILAQQSGKGGLMLTIDEAGKCLEYALLDKEGGDIYLFQMLAEYANGTKNDCPFLFFTVQHQHFEGYTETFNSTLRKEWSKVQERFETISFNEQTNASIVMLGQVFEYPHGLPKNLSEAVGKEAHQLLDSGAQLPPGLSEQEFYSICQHSWPLHPSVVLTLPILFRRMAQNERSLFSYLSSLEPHGFQEHCAQEINSDNEFVRLHDIGSYLLANMSSVLIQRPAGRSLLDACANCIDLTPLQENLLKTIGVLHMLGSASFLKATEELLSCALGKSINELQQALTSMRYDQLLSFRGTDKSYHLWEGGLIDLEELISKAQSQVRTEGEAFLELLRTYLPQKPLVARKHSLETGAYRFFTIDYALTPASNDAFSKTSSCEAGKIVVVLPLENISALEENIKKVSSKNNRTIFALPRQIDMIRKAALELASLRFVEQHTFELQGDRRALREFNQRLAEAERQIRQCVSLLLDPRPAPLGNNCLWFWQGQQVRLHSLADITRLISRACDEIYRFTPAIHNELVARPFISAVATGARTLLLKRMLHNENEPNLGIELYPPERSMYASTLLATGLHRKQDDSWKFCPPGTNTRLGQVWRFFENAIFGAGGNALCLKQLYEKLSQPPYGIPEGLHPIFLLVFYICNQKELFIYRENSFLITLKDTDIELMQRRPDLFAISGVHLKGERLKLVERYASGLNVEPTVPAVVGSLYKALNQLPALTRHTEHLTPNRGKALRDAFTRARFPEKLLFEELPLALGLPSLLSSTNFGRADDLAQAIRESMTELVRYTPSVLKQCRDVWLKHCGLAQGESGWHAFKERAIFLSGTMPLDSADQLSQLLRYVEREGTEAQMIRSLAIIRGRSFEQWTDSDVSAFPQYARATGEQFRRAWEKYGSTYLTQEEVRSKNEICTSLNSQIALLKKSYSSHVLCEALRELLRQVEDLNEGGGRA